MKLCIAKREANNAKMDHTINVILLQQGVLYLVNQIQRKLAYSVDNNIKLKSENTTCCIASSKHYEILSCSNYTHTLLLAFIILFALLRSRIYHPIVVNFMRHTIQNLTPYCSPQNTSTVVFLTQIITIYHRNIKLRMDNGCINS